MLDPERKEVAAAFRWVLALGLVGLSLILAFHAGWGDGYQRALEDFGHVKAGKAQ